MIVVVMGVAGAGKTTVGRQLAETLSWLFLDADTFHSPENVRKMASGEALTDEDRAPWLLAMRATLIERTANSTNVILACSALKERYRDVLRVEEAPTRFVYLKGDRSLLQQRLRERPGHFMKETMLDSQLAALEDPTDAIVVGIDQPLPQIVEQIRAALGV